MRIPLALLSSSARLGLRWEGRLARLAPPIRLQAALVAQLLEEPFLPRLRSEEEARRRRPPGQFHESAADALTLPGGIDHNIRDGAEEVAVGEQADAADESLTTPGRDVGGTPERLLR
jgi:hypothetical protein